MEAKELMIGDWVYNKNIDKPMQVYPMMFSQMFRQRPDATTEDYNISPIPLTPEILEKNGFVFDGSGQWSMMFLSEPRFSEELRFNIYVGLKRKTIEVFAAHPIEKSPNWRKSNKVYLEVCGCYVHELQHAFHLCGIEKEIML